MRGRQAIGCTLIAAVLLRYCYDMEEQTVELYLLLETAASEVLDA